MHFQIERHTHTSERERHCFPYAHSHAGTGVYTGHRAFAGKLYFLLVRLVASIQDCSRGLFKYVDRVTGHWYQRDRLIVLHEST